MRLQKQTSSRHFNPGVDKRPHGIGIESTQIIVLMYYHIVHFFAGFILDLLLHLKAFVNSTEFANEASTLKNDEIKF